MDQAILDDELDRIIKTTIDRYLSNKRGATIKQTQLNALASEASSRGAKGMAQMIAKRRRDNERNQRAFSEGKGGTKPKNPAFWQTLDEMTGKELADLAQRFGHADELFADFTRLLAIEMQFRDTLGSRK